MELKSAWFCIGRSGPTIDGRIIKPEWLTQAAETYSLKTFTAKIWPDHNRYISYGKVLALRTENNDQGGVDLFATLAPNAYYQSDVRYDQKVHFSIEITEDFAKSGKAYLSGLGATDDPASLGTSEARFSKYAEQAGVYRGAFVEAEAKTFANETTNSLFAKFKAFLKFEANEEDDMASADTLKQLQQQFAVMNGNFAKLFTKLGIDDEAQADDKPITPAADDEKFAALSNQVTELTTKIDDALKQFSAKSDKSNNDEIKVLKDQLETFGQKLAEALQEQPGTNAGQHFSANDTELTDC